MSSFTKITAFPMSSANAESLANVAATLKNVSGVHSVFYGPSNDNTRTYLVVNWSSEDAWKSFVSSEAFIAFAEKLKSFGVAADFAAVDVAFTPNPPLHALEAPVTCFARFVVPNATDEIPSGLRDLLAPMPESIKRAGSTGGAFGQVKGKSEIEGVVMQGWQTVNAQKAGADQPPLIHIRGKLGELGAVPKLTYAYLKRA